MTTTTCTRSTGKVRRDWGGGKRGDGHRLQRLGRRIRRPDARRMAMCETKAQLTAVAGLIPVGAFVRDIGIDAQLQRLFDRMKTGLGVVYPMGAQLRLLMDVFAVGEQRPFAVESLCADPLFAHLSGGSCPSVDTLYRDLDRFDDGALAALEQMVASQGLALLHGRR